MRNKMLEFEVSNFSFEKIVKIFGKNQQMRIDLLHLFEPNKTQNPDFDHNEDFFADRYITLGMFQRFLKLIGQYEILCMLFEIEDGTLFKIEDEIVTIKVHPQNEGYVLKAISQVIAGQSIPPLNAFEGKYNGNQNELKYQSKKSVSDGEFFGHFELNMN